MGKATKQRGISPERVNLWSLFEVAEFKIGPVAKEFSLCASDFMVAGLQSPDEGRASRLPMTDY